MGVGVFPERQKISVNGERAHAGGRFPLTREDSPLKDCNRNYS
jgi:hypothetical protein